MLKAAMDAPRWDRLKDVFATASELGDGERDGYLESIASADPDLARWLEMLLDADARAEALLHPFEVSTGVATPGSRDDPFGLAGRTVSHFRVMDVLGCGGMGVVYRAEDVRLARTVALKFLLPQYALDPVARERFLHEARAASALDHPNICTVYEVGGRAEGHLFLAMACYPGETLRARLAREGALPAKMAMDIGRQVLLALGAAHDVGIVHRDLKPANVMLTPDGTAKILDFGLAKVRDVPLTDPALRPGTVAYMSPEQVEGEGVDHRADLWALGVTMYEMLTGRRPFGGGHDLSTVSAILHDEPILPSRLRAELSDRHDAIVIRLLRKDRTERYASAAAALADVDAESREPSRDGDAGTPAQPPPRRRRRLVAAVTLIGLLAAGVGGAAMLGASGNGTLAARLGAWLGGAPAASVPASERRSIAVLPFVDMSAERDQEYFGDGVAEEILNALAQSPELHVAARTSSFSFKERQVPVREIARQLGVDAVLEGSVRKVDDRVRITTQLVDARSERQLWARTFDRDLDNVFAVQAEIALTVAEALRVRLAASTRGGGAARPPASAVAHDAYLQGRFHWNRRSTDDLRRAIRHFEDAIRADSAYARAHAGLALAYAVLPISTANTPAAEAFARAEAAAARALALDSTLSDAHAARGYAYHWQWRWADAEGEFRRAVALGPENTTARQWYGEHLAKMGRRAEGEVQLRRAIALDPLSLVVNNDLGIVLLLAGRYREAVEQFERTHRMDPSFWIPLLLLHRTHLIAGDVEAAATAGRRFAELRGRGDGADYVTLARATRDPAGRPAALAILARWARQPAPSWADLAQYYVLLGERERAIAALENGLRERSPMMARLKVAPWFDPLRGDPRFERIVRAMGFP